MTSQPNDRGSEGLFVVYVCMGISAVYALCKGQLYNEPIEWFGSFYPGFCTLMVFTLTADKEFLPSWGLLRRGLLALVLILAPYPTAFALLLVFGFVGENLVFARQNYQSAIKLMQLLIGFGCWLRVYHPKLFRY